MLYKELDPATVPDHTKRAAAKALDYGCRLLGFALPPELTFMRPATQAEVKAADARWPDRITPPGFTSHAIPAGRSGSQLRGMADDHWRIWIATGFSDRETVHAVLHELMHQKYLRDGRRSEFGTTARDIEEADCEVFARRHVGSLGL